MHILTVSAIVFGAAIFVVLGSVHALYTFQSSPEGGPMTPVTPEVRAAMTQRGGLGLAPGMDSTLWRAWVGFNMSHSLGAVAIGLAIAVPAVADVDAATGNPAWLVLALVAPALYLVMSVRYWFRSPTIGIAVGGGAIYLGTIGQLLS